MQKLIAMGAVDIIVPGVMPFGCFALYLTELKSSNKSDYDDYGCLKPLNELAIHHNSLLQTSLAAVQARHRRSPSSSPSSPSPAAAVRIMYADYYAVVAEMMQAPARLGFRSGIAACCGAGGGEYNWEYVARCGMRGAAACANPSSAVVIRFSLNLSSNILTCNPFAHSRKKIFFEQIRSHALMT